MLLPLLLTSAIASAAQDVLIPEFSPGAPDDFGVSFLIYDAIVYDLRDSGVDVIDGDAIRAAVGDRGDHCIESSDCPDALFSDFPARVAVVGRVSQGPGGLEILVELYDPNNAVPVKTIEELVASGDEYDFTARISQQVQELLPLVPPREAAPPDLAPLHDTFDDDTFDDGPSLTVETPAVEDRLPSRTLDDDQARMLGVGDRAYAEFQRSGLPMDLWRAEARLRSFQLSFEAQAGVGLGNIADTYDVRVAFDVHAGETLDTFQSRALGGGADLQWSLGLGYHPRAWIETGLLFGFQRGTKHLSVGWESYNAGQQVDAYEYTYDSAISWQGLIEPRARLYALTTGAFKPYALLAVSLRMLDGYDVPPSGLVEYPNQPGGTLIDGVLGAGVMIDTSENFSIFVELPYGFDLSPFQGAQVESARLSAVPDTNEGTRTLLRASAGIQTRF